MLDSAAMDSKLFSAFCDIAYAQAGMRLREGKESLVAARIAKRMRVLGLHDAEEYLALVQNDNSGSEVVQFLDAMATNFTQFFREPGHFQYLSHHVKERVRSGATRLRFWSAASSTGEEPYTMAMTVADALGSGWRDFDWRILATDISTKVLAVAAKGEYDGEIVEKVPEGMRKRYFSSTTRDGEKRYRVADELKQHMAFKRMNLAAPPYPMPGPVDFVFCRNVMIYFDAPVRQGIVTEVERMLRPDSLFCIGHSESLQTLHSDFVVVEPSVYARSSAVAGWREAMGVQQHRRRPVRTTGKRTS